MAFIRLGDIVINLNCVVTVKFSTYNIFGEHSEIPTVNICLAMPEGALDGETADDTEKDQFSQLEVEGDLATAVWDYFLKSSDVTVLFE